MSAGGGWSPKAGLEGGERGFGSAWRPEPLSPAGDSFSLCSELPVLWFGAEKTAPASAGCGSRKERRERAARGPLWPQPLLQAERPVFSPAATKSGDLLTCSGALSGPCRLCLVPVLLLVGGWGKLSLCLPMYRMPSVFSLWETTLAAVFRDRFWLLCGESRVGGKILFCTLLLILLLLRFFSKLIPSYDLPQCFLRYRRQRIGDSLEGFSLPAVNCNKLKLR